MQFGQAEVRQQLSPENREFLQALVDLPPFHVGLYKGATLFAKSFPITTTLYCLGMVLITFGSGITVPEGAQEEHGRLLENAQPQVRALEKAEASVAKASEEYNAKRSFLGFSCNAACTASYEKLQHETLIYKQVEEEHNTVMSNAKSKVGVLSTYAVQESQEKFWVLMGAGKEFAKRQSMFDIMFLSLTSIGSDEGWVSFLIRFAVEVLVNFSVGLLGALIRFIWRLWELIASYQPDMLTAVTAFLLFSITACSMVATYLLALCGTLAASLYMTSRTVGRFILEGTPRQSVDIRELHRKLQAAQQRWREQEQQEQQRQRQQQQQEQQQQQPPQQESSVARPEVVRVTAGTLWAQPPAYPTRRLALPVVPRQRLEGQDLV